jgi:hypothetical protein
MHKALGLIPTHTKKESKKDIDDIPPRFIPA